MYNITYKNKSISIHPSINTKFLKNRCRSYENDEPNTISWLENINDTMNKQSKKDKIIFYDIGSNIGGFSYIMNMINSDYSFEAEIYSFEPNITNYFVQKKTCMMNKLNNVHVMNIALNDKNEFSDFYMQKTDYSAGGSGTFGTILKEEMKQSQYSNPHREGCAYNVKTLGLTLDFMIYSVGLPVPNYIKIDVDGNESLIMKGATKLLKDTQLKEVLIEIDNKINDVSYVYETFEKNGFKKKKVDDLGRDMVMITYSRSF